MSAGVLDRVTLAIAPSRLLKNAVTRAETPDHVAAALVLCAFVAYARLAMKPILAAP